MRIVVLDGRNDRYAQEVTASIAAALDVDDEGTEKTEAPAPSAESRGVDELLHAADAAVVMDPGSLTRAEEAGVGLCAVVFPGFDLAWGGDLADADLVIVPHERLVSDAVRRGAPRGRVEVAGPIAPKGYAAPEDRAALREELELPADAPLVLVPAAILEEHGAENVMVQLALANDRTGYLFDVGLDAEAAEAIRRLAPVHGLTAWMFSEEPGSEQYWQAVDAVVARARGYEVARALAVGAPVVLLPPGRSDRLAAETLEAIGVGSDAEVLATLAVSIDRTVEDKALAEAREAIGALDIPYAAGRVSDRVRAAWNAQRVAGDDRPRGLPHGLEALPKDDVEAPSPRRPSRLDALEDRIERELAEIKRKLED
jgi:hypothetical protein